MLGAQDSRGVSPPASLPPLLAWAGDAVQDNSEALLTGAAKPTLRQLPLQRGTESKQSAAGGLRGSHSRLSAAEPFSSWALKLGRLPDLPPPPPHLRSEADGRGTTEAESREAINGEIIGQAALDPPQSPIPSMEDFDRQTESLRQQIEAMMSGRTAEMLKANGTTQTAQCLQQHSDCALPAFQEV